MLKYNLKRIFNARLINKPIGFLMNSGFKNHSAHSILSGKTKSLTPEKIEKLCIALHCTPNDLFDWTEDSKHSLDNNHPLRNLKRNSDNDNLLSITKTLPLDQLSKLSQQLTPNP